MPVIMPSTPLHTDFAMLPFIASSPLSAIYAALAVRSSAGCADAAAAACRFRRFADFIRLMPDCFERQFFCRHTRLRLPRAFARL